MSEMEAGHDWSPDTRLQGCAGSLVADMLQNQHRKRLANIIRLSTSKPLILASKWRQATIGVQTQDYRAVLAT